MDITVDKKKPESVLADFAKGVCGNCPLDDNGKCLLGNTEDYKGENKHICRVKIEKALHCEKLLTDDWLLSCQERGLLDIFSPRYNYIARDKNGELFMYVDKPRKTRTNWEVKSIQSIVLISLIRTFHRFSGMMRRLGLLPICYKLKKQ